MAFQSVTVTRPYEQIVEQIAAEIQAGRLVHGQQLPTERELSATFGVSRGVVREAVKVLSAMGLVEPRQGSGLFVHDDPLPLVTRALTLSVSPDEKSVGRLFEFRRALEVFAARSAAERRSDDHVMDISGAALMTREAATTNDVSLFSHGDNLLHTGVYSAADNPYLAIAAGAVRGMQTDVVDLFRSFPGSIAVAADQHCRIAEAITEQDGDAASAAMDEHIRYAAKTVEAILNEPSEKGEQAACKPGSY